MSNVVALTDTQVNLSQKDMYSVVMNAQTVSHMFNQSFTLRLQAAKVEVQSKDKWLGLVRSVATIVKLFMTLP